MQNSTAMGLTAALVSGIAIGAQVTLNGVAGRALGAGRAGLIVNLASGVLACTVILMFVISQGAAAWQISRSEALVATASGALGILIVTGIAFAVPRSGVAAGLAALFLGQMVIGAVVDTLGVGGGSAIPLDLRRIVGLLGMGGAVTLLLPKA